MCFAIPSFAAAHNRLITLNAESSDIAPIDRSCAPGRHRDLVTRIAGQPLVAGCPAATSRSLVFPTVRGMSESNRVESAGKPGFTRRRFIIGTVGAGAAAALVKGGGLAPRTRAA